MNPLVGFACKSTCSATIAFGAPIAFLTRPRSLLPIDLSVDMSRSGENYGARAGCDEFEMAEEEDGRN
jgi:hypothetical protein